MGGDLGGDVQTFRPPFRFHHPPIPPPSPCPGRRRDIRTVFPGQNAARERAVGHDPKAKIAASWQNFDFDFPVQRVIQWLGSDGPVDARLIAKAADLGDTPAPVIRYTEIADFACPDQIRQSMNCLRQRRRVVFLVQIQQVDFFHAQAPQGRMHGIEDMPP